MSLLYGKDDNNNLIPVSVDNEGFMWDNLRYWRSQGRCYATTTNLSTNNETKGVMSIVNPTGSTDKIYIYDITINMSATFTSLYAYLNIYRLDGDPDSGTTSSGSNLQVGSDDASGVKIRTNITSGNYSSQLDGVIFSRLFRATSSSSDAENTFVVNLYNEMIELQENTGILIECANSSSSNIMTTCNVRFMSIPSAQII